MYSGQVPIWSVSDVNRAVRDLVEGSLPPFWLGGEVGSLTMHRSGHVYFTLKDEHCQVRVCYFNGLKECSNLGLDNGSLIEAEGRLTVYEVRGEYQFSVRHLRLAGLGTLQRRFEELRKKLEAEGCFAPERKRPIPMLPQTIGVVSSPTGAAIRDFLQIINRRFPDVHVRLYPCLVQGVKAAAEVARGVEFFNRTGSADVIVVTRGGGSMEDLWPFNEEMVARAVLDSKIPVISAVGHEIDFTICDFVADLRVPTPSAAAELVIGPREELHRRLQQAKRGLTSQLQLGISRARSRLERVAGSFVFNEPRRLIDLRRQRLDELDIRFLNAGKLFLERRNNRIEQLERSLQTLNPQRQLERGYTMVMDEAGHLLGSRTLAVNRRVKLQFSDGVLGAQTDVE